MTTELLPPPPYCSLDALPAQLRQPGYAVLNPQALAALASVGQPQLDALAPSWNDLKPDQYLKDGGRYRLRRHACFIAEAGQLTLAPARAHWQPLEYNALHGGMQRWFAPIESSVLAQPAWSRLLLALADVASALRGAQRWYVEAHQFRIDTTGGIGRPTPEGAHRDGVDLVAVLLVQRHQIKGGETRVFDAAGPNGQRFCLTEAWSALVLDDARVIHESTPIQPRDLALAGWRDTLVLTYRAGGFQGEG